MVYENFSNFQNEDDERNTRKYGDKYKYVKWLYPDVYKLPKKEVEEMIDIARWHGDTLEEGQAELDKYIEANEPEWKKLYFGQGVDSGLKAGLGQNTKVGQQLADSQALLNPQKAIMKKTWQQSDLTQTPTFGRPLSQNTIETGMEEWAKMGHNTQSALESNEEKEKKFIENYMNSKEYKINNQVKNEYENSWHFSLPDVLDVGHTVKDGIDVGIDSIINGGTLGLYEMIDNWNGGNVAKRRENVRRIVAEEGLEKPYDIYNWGLNTIGGFCTGSKPVKFAKNLTQKQIQLLLKNAGDKGKRVADYLSNEFLNSKKVVDDYIYELLLKNR